MDSVFSYSAKQKKFCLIDSIGQVQRELNGEMPNEHVSYKMISDGGFSSASLIAYVAGRTTINDLFVTTLRVGKKEIRMLDGLHTVGKLKNAKFLVGALMKRTDDTAGMKKYEYFDIFQKICEKNKWEARAINNHSKLILMDTVAGKYVIETSSNLNENPKIEFFNFEKSNESFEFYKKWFNRWFDSGGDKN